MAAVVPSSDQAADLLKDLSLDSETKTDEIQEPAKEGAYGDNENLVYNQGYSYVPLGGFSSVNPAVGHDGHQYGTQQYQYPGSFYHHQTSSGTYFPPNQSSYSQGEVTNSTTAEKVPLSVGSASGNPNNLVNTGNVNRNNGPKLFRPNNQYSSTNSNGSYKRRGSQAGYLGYQDPRIGYEGFQAPYAWYDASMFANASTQPTGAGFSSSMNSHATRPTSGLGQATGFMNWMYPNARMYGQYGNGAPFGSFGWTNGSGWLVVDNKCKPRFRGYGNENMDGLSELNRGPRAKGFKNQEFGSATHAEGKNLPLTENNKEETLSQIPEKDQYNREDFAEEYLDAKFFVIKSYSEDDVHKSIKYGVWASTPNGNKKLDAAYSKAKAVSGGCPVFLLFSVNTSGQFVGLAEMSGPVDFNRTVEYWQQDKWTGCFPVKWHIIKDVPNSTLRHITLENNENKPVTNSRDTQEVILEKGIQILKIFKDHKGKTSILDDFGFYAARERIMQEKRAKQKTQKQTTDGKLSDDVTDKKNEVAMVGKESSVKGATLVKETVNGDVKLPEQNGSVETVENSSKDTKSVASSVPNVVAASAC